MKITLSNARKRYIERQVKAGRYAGPGQAVDAALRLLEARDRVASGQRAGLLAINSADGDTAALAFIVMMQAARDMNEDLKATMAEVKAATAAKQHLRELIRKIRRDVAANAGRGSNHAAINLTTGLGSERAYHRVPMPSPDPDATAGVRLVITDLHPGRIKHVEQLQAILDDLKGELDSLSELSELESLRLQMLMDRRSKFISTLSNLLKKISSTQDTLIQDLK